MKNLFDYIKKHKTVTFFVLLGSLGAIILVPVIINLCYKFTCPIVLFQAEWNASDALNYYGVVLSFLGTTMLSLLALWQNHIMKEESDKHTKKLELMEYQKNAPIIIVEQEPGLGSMGITSEIKMTIKNLSDNLAQNITLTNYMIANSNIIIWESDCENHYPYLHKDLSYTISLDNPSLNDGDLLKFKICYYDVYDHCYMYECVVQKNNTNNNLIFCIKKKT